MVSIDKMPSITKALNESTAAQGGYLVPEEWSNQLLALVRSKSVVMDDLEIVPMATDTMFIPKVTSGTTAYWPGETGAITESAPGYGQITLSAKKIASLVQASSEVLEDNNINLATSLVEQMGGDLSVTLDGTILTGSCSTTNNTAAASPFYGLYHTASYTNAVDAAGNTNKTGAWGTGATASALTGANITLKAIVNAVTEITSDKHLQPDVSYWNPRTIGSLALLTDSTSRPILDQNTYGNPLMATGYIGRLYGTQAKQSTQVPINIVYGTTAALSACSDAFVGRSKMFGILGQRRGFIWKTDYTISTDVYVWQTTARMAFAVKYPDAYCLIRAILN
jgi:HK97 family phage major capsid protein